MVPVQVLGLAFLVAADEDSLPSYHWVRLVGLMAEQLEVATKAVGVRLEPRLVVEQLGVAAVESQPSFVAPETTPRPYPHLLDGVQPGEELLPPAASIAPPHPPMDRRTMYPTDEA